MKGLTLETLRRRTDEWHDELSRRWEVEVSGIPYAPTWKGASYQELELEQQGSIYRIVQLTSVADLREEGRAMRHCVGGYAWKCQRDGTSIWSLRQITEEQPLRLVTIEVSNTHMIVQAKQKHNASPTNFQWELIRKWAGMEQLIL